MNRFIQAPAKPVPDFVLTTVVDGVEQETVFMDDRMLVINDVFDSASRARQSYHHCQVYRDRSRLGIYMHWQNQCERENDQNVDNLSAEIAQ